MSRDTINIILGTVLCMCAVIIVMFIMGYILISPAMASIPESGEIPQHNEAAYRDAYAGMLTEIYGDNNTVSTEVTLSDRSRVDIMTENVVIEVEFARKWEEGIGQALHYANVTGKRPVILLIIQDLKELRYVYAAREATKYLNIWLEIRFVTPEIFQ